MTTTKPTSTFYRRGTGQSLVEFALILPLFVLFMVGIFDLGRAFFSYIAITNAAREGTRVVTFWPGNTTVTNINIAIQAELANSPVVKWDNVNKPIQITCGSAYTPVITDADLKACPSEQPLRITVTYQFDTVFKFFYPDPITISRTAEMMIP